MKLIFALLLAASSCGSFAQGFGASASAPSSNPWARIPQTQAEADALHGITLIPPLPAPAGLAGAQLDAWNFLTSRPGFKSIEIVKLDPSVAVNGSVTLNIKGKAYVIEGKTERKVFTGNLLNPATGKREEVTSGFTTWHGETNGATGSLTFFDNGEVNGSFAIMRVGNFNVLTKAGLTFLVEHDYAAEGAAKRAATSPN